MWVRGWGLSNPIIDGRGDPAAKKWSLRIGITSQCRGGGVIQQVTATKGVAAISIMVCLHPGTKFCLVPFLLKQIGGLI